MSICLNGDSQVQLNGKNHKSEKRNMSDSYETVELTEEGKKQGFGLRKVTKLAMLSKSAFQKS